MNEQQQALKNAIDNQSSLISEINEMSNLINTKKEMALKLQGVIEYLTSTGVVLSEESRSINITEDSKDN